MIRRRRRAREIPFSFDSFLDVVANVVGIIIRLILVVWVGARTYTGIQTTTPSASVELEAPARADPLVSEVEQRRRELALVQNRLSDQLRLLDDTGTKERAPADEWAGLEKRRRQLEGERATLDKEAARRGEIVRGAALSGQELRERSRRLMEEIKAIEKMPPVKKTLQYKTPVSQ